MKLAIVTKTPSERLDWDIDFAPWLPEGDRIVSHVAAIEGGTATIDASENSDTQVKVYLEGGADGERSTVSVDATTEGGRIKNACFDLRVRDC